MNLKKNNYFAFTLIELLAVMVIIGILATVAVPAINKTVTNSRKELYAVQMKGIEGSAKTWASKNNAILPDDEGELITITLGQLKNEGFIEDDVRNPLTKQLFPNDMEITITRSFNNYEYEVIEESGGINNTIDRDSPMIILNGYTHETVEINSQYIDKGVVAKGPDKNFINDIDVVIEYGGVVVPEVDTGKLGQHKITYTVNYNGIVASAIRTVTVKDTIPPILTLPSNIYVSLSSDIANFDFLKDVIATDNSLKPPIIKTSGTLSTLIGTYYIYYTATDESGNSTTSTRKIVIIDDTPPTIIFGTNGNNIYSKTGRTSVTVSDFHSKVDTSTLKYLWNTSTTKPSVDAFKDSFENEANLNTPVGVTGDYYLWILAYDSAGNKIIERSNYFRLDNLPPTCLSSGGSAAWTNGSRIITGACSDNGGSGCSSVTVSKAYSTNINTTTAGPGTVTDMAGNVATCPTDQTVKIDKTAPSCATGGGSATWTNANKTITGTCTDAGGSGCTGNASKAYTTNTNTTAASPGTVSDNAGNSVTCSADQTVKIDKTAPTCASSGGSSTWTNGNRTITGTCTDTGGSGCTGNATKTYSTNTNTTAAGPGTVSDAAGNSVTCSANQTVKIDKTAPTYPQIASGTMIYRDPTFASGTNSMTVYNNSGNGLVTHQRVALSNPKGSYVMRIKTSGTASPGLGGFVHNTTSAANRVYTHVIYAKIPVGYQIQRASNAVGDGASHTWLTSRDGTGDWREYIYITRSGATGSFSTFGHVYLTGTAATSTKPVTWDVAYSTIIDQTYWGKTGSVIFQANDSGGSNIVGYGINTSSTTQPTYTSVSATSSLALDLANKTSNATYYVWVKDAAGNTANKSIALNRVDRTAPTCASSGGSTAWTNGSRTITGTCSDTGGSGCTGNVSQSYTTNTNTTAAGPGTVYDNAGNSVACPANQTVRIDKTAPSCASSGGSTAWVTSRTITGTCSDTGGSGCAGNVTKGYSTTTNTTVASPGSVKDNAGNTVSCPANQTVRVDVTAPTTFTTSIGTRTTSSIVVSASGVSDANSGLHSTAYSYSSNGGSTWTGWVASSSYTVSGLAAGTTYSMRVRVRDAVGNVRTGTSVSAKTLLTVTKTYAISSAQTYRGSVGSIYNNYPLELIQGTYDGTIASTRNTLIIFPNSTIRTDTAGATINSIRVRVKRLDTAHGRSADATLYVHSHNYSTMPTSWYNTGITQRATASIGRGQELWISLPVAVGNGFRDNTIKGLAVSTTSTVLDYYVRLDKARTLLEITYTK